MRLKRRPNLFLRFRYRSETIRKRLMNPNDVFIQHPVRRDLAVKSLFFLSEFLLASAFDGEYGIGVDFLDSKVSRVRFEQDRRYGSDS